MVQELTENPDHGASPTDLLTSLLVSDGDNQKLRVKTFRFSGVRYPRNTDAIAVVIHPGCIVTTAQGHSVHVSGG